MDPHKRSATIEVMAATRRCWTGARMALTSPGTGLWLFGVVVVVLPRVKN